MILPDAFAPSVEYHHIKRKRRLQYDSFARPIIIGLGCAPIYPSMIHSTPERFGAEQSQAIIGVQMASAYIGICVMPPLFGILAERISVALLPAYLLVILILMRVMFLLLDRRAANATEKTVSS